MYAGTLGLHGKHEALIPKPKPITLNIPNMFQHWLNSAHFSALIAPLPLPVSCLQLVFFRPLSHKSFNHLGHDGVQLAYLVCSRSWAFGSTVARPVPSTHACEKRRNDSAQAHMNEKVHHDV